MNIVLLIGRITNNIEIKEVGDGYSKANITLAVRREFKNSNGEFDTDFVPITLWEGAATTCKEFCTKGQLISIRCRIQTQKIDLEDGKFYNQVEIIGEKLCLLGTSKTQKES